MKRYGGNFWVEGLSGGLAVFTTTDLFRVLHLTTAVHAPFIPWALQFGFGVIGAVTIYRAIGYILLRRIQGRKDTPSFTFP